MNSYRLFFITISLFFAFDNVLAESDLSYSQIDEKLILNPPQAGGDANNVMIYSHVREKTIDRAMNEQFERIENMMFINTVIESESGDIAIDDNDEC
jgi:hypothetical protein